MSCYNLLRCEQQAFWESLTHQAGDTCDLQMREWFRTTGAQLLRAAGKLPAVKKAEVEEWGYWVYGHFTLWHGWSSRHAAERERAHNERVSPSPRRGPVQRKSDPNPFEVKSEEHRWGVMLVGSDGVALHWCFDKNGDRVYSTRAEAEMDRAETVVTIGNYRAEVRPYPGPTSQDGDKTLDTCRSTYSNKLTFRGFPYVPPSTPIAPTPQKPLANWRAIISVGGPPIRTFTEHALAVAIAQSDPALLAIVDRVSEGDPKRREANIGKAVARDEAGAMTAAEAIAKRVFGGQP